IGHGQGKACGRCARAPGVRRISRPLEAGRRRAHRPERSVRAIAERRRKTVRRKLSTELRHEELFFSAEDRRAISAGPGPLCRGGWRRTLSRPAAFESERIHDVQGKLTAMALAENRSENSRVRLGRVKRPADRHDFQEWSVRILLQGDFDSCFTEGDNSKILATDTMKNTVYSLARDSSAKCIEELPREIVDFLLRRNPQASQAEGSIAEKAWERAVAAGKPHPTTFVQSSGERSTTKVSRSQHGKVSMESGIENLVIMKTAGSGFEGYIQNSLTTLPPAADRLFGTALKANWKYGSAIVGFGPVRAKIREILIAEFADHDSKYVQQTLYGMGDAVLKEIPEVSEIELTMPNLHCLLVDLSRFGQTNPNEIFVPTDEPHGYIEATIRRHR